MGATGLATRGHGLCGPAGTRFCVERDQRQARDLAGDTGPGSIVVLDDADLALEACADLARRLVRNRPGAIVLATSLALAHLVDRETSLALPAGSRVMQTGGFKGRRREVDVDTVSELRG